MGTQRNKKRTKRAIVYTHWMIRRLLMLPTLLGIKIELPNITFQRNLDVWTWS